MSFRRPIDEWFHAKSWTLGRAFHVAEYRGEIDLDEFVSTYRKCYPRLNDLCITELVKFAYATFQSATGQIDDDEWALVNTAATYIGEKSLGWSYGE